MKVRQFSKLPAFPSEAGTPEENRDYLAQLVKALNDELNDVYKVINGQLGFGDGLTLDNIFGTPVNITAPGTANIEFSVAHQNAKIPTGFLVCYQDRAGSLYKDSGGTPWTTTLIYLKSSTASLSARLFII